MSTGEGEKRYVGRGGLKLAAALDEFAIDPSGWECADFGCNVGGFADCLLQRGAARVHAIDTGYGMLDYGLRVDPRVVVRERTSALHAEPPEGGVDLVVIDMGWTPQSRALPAALRWLRPDGQIITLIKPHYEASHGPEKERLVDGVLDEPAAREVLARVQAELPACGVDVERVMQSPIVGGGGSRRSTGNIEFLALLRPR